MKTLLQSIQTELQDGVEDVRERDVFLTPDPDILPDHVKMPCIGIKDGPVTRKDLMGGCVEKTLPVGIHCYVRLLKDEAPILALLDIAAAVVEALDDNLLDGYVREVSTGDESPITVMMLRDGLILRKTLNFEYVKEA